MRNSVCAAALAFLVSGCGGCEIEWNATTFDGGSYPEYPPYDGGTIEADFGPLRASEAKPISGGTLAIDDAHHRIAVGDPDRDVVHIVDAEQVILTRSIALQRGDDPGRATFGPDGTLYVVLRGAGAIARIDPEAGVLLERRAVCPSPRGLAYDPANQELLVACLDGRLLRMAPDAPERDVTAEFVMDDLRDVVVENGRIWVSQFRGARVALLVDGRLPKTFVLESTVVGATRFEPSVAWRMIPAPEGGVALLHQRASDAPLSIASPGGYYRSARDCTSPVVVSAVSRIDPSGAIVSGGPLSSVVLAVDFALGSDKMYVAHPGSSARRTSISEFPSDLMKRTRCLQPNADDLSVGLDVIAVDQTRDGDLVFFSREPPQVWVGGRRLLLPGESRRDTGHEMFHRDVGTWVACASCHPEGRDDGRVWNFTPLGPRRTQGLFNVADTAPFHWEGDLATLDELLEEVMMRRMGGDFVTHAQVRHLERWLRSIPPLPATQPIDEEAKARGRVVFDAVGCGACHSGPLLTNSTTVDVGTGGAFQVPSLIGVHARAPYLHDGCAATLRARFGDCGGGDSHGVTSALTSGELDDLVVFLESL